VYVPIVRGPEQGEVRTFAQVLAQELRASIAMITRFFYYSCLLARRPRFFFCCVSLWIML